MNMNKIRPYVALALAAVQMLLPVSGALAQDIPQPDAGGGAPPAQDAAAAPAPDAGGGDFTMPTANPPGTPLDASGGSPQPLYEETERVEPMEKKIMVRLRGAPLSAFLETVSAQSGINFVVSDKVAQDVTISAFLPKVTAREALQILLRMHGLTYERVGKSHTYVILKRSARARNVVTKIYTLSFISLLAGETSQQEMSAITSADVSFTGGFSGGGGGGAGGGQSGGGGGGQGGAGASEGVAIINVLRSVMSRTGTIASEPRTNSLIVTDDADRFPQIEQVLSELDKKAPQVLIEAKIMEINSTRLNEMGIEWGGSRGELAYFQGPTRLTDYFLRPGFFSGDQWKYMFPDPSSIVTSGGGSGGGSGGSGASMGPGGITYGTFSLSQLTAMLRLLVSRSDARYLSHPKVVTLNNKMALINISQDAAVSVTSTVTQTTTTGTLERRRVGVTLRVTPQVNKDGYITLFIQPSYSDIQASAVTNNGQTVYDPVSRGASTMMRVKNGSTVVLGGLLSSTDNKLVRKVPLLGYIPLIGWLFTSVSQTRKNSDLVLFVTPTILVD
ncbi:MAG: secretin N-terminal domain-containing protein [Elusimicrobiales bacterium]